MNEKISVSYRVTNLIDTNKFNFIFTAKDNNFRKYFIPKYNQSL